MRRGLGGHAHAAALRPAHGIDAAGGRNVHDVHPPAGRLGQGDVAAGHHVFGRGGHAGQPEHQRDQPLVHHAALGQLADFGVVEDRLVEHQAVFERPAHQLGIVDRRAVVAEGDGPGLDQLADFGQFLPFAVLADAGHDKDVAMIGPGGLVPDELDRGLAVDRRIGVRDAGDRGEAAGQRGRRAASGSSRLPRGPARAGGRACRSARGRRSAGGVDHFRRRVACRRRRRRCGRRRSRRWSRGPCFGWDRSRGRFG